MSGVEIGLIPIQYMCDSYDEKIIKPRLKSYRGVFQIHAADLAPR